MTITFNNEERELEIENNGFFGKEEFAKIMANMKDVIVTADVSVYNETYVDYRIEALKYGFKVTPLFMYEKEGASALNENEIPFIVRSPEDIYDRISGERKTYSLSINLSSVIDDTVKLDAKFFNAFETEKDIVLNMSYINLYAEERCKEKALERFSKRASIWIKLDMGYFPFEILPMLKKESMCLSEIKSVEFKSFHFMPIDKNDDVLF